MSKYSTLSLRGAILSTHVLKMLPLMPMGCLDPSLTGWTDCDCFNVHVTPPKLQFLPALYVVEACNKFRGQFHLFFFLEFLYVFCFFFHILFSIFSSLSHRDFLLLVSKPLKLFFFPGLIVLCIPPPSSTPPTPSPSPSSFSSSPSLRERQSTSEFTRPSSVSHLSLKATPDKPSQTPRLSLLVLTPL